MVQSPALFRNIFHSPVSLGYIQQGFDTHMEESRRRPLVPRPAQASGRAILYEVLYGLVSAPMLGR